MGKLPIENKIISFFSINTQFENVGDALINRELVALASDMGRVKVDLSRCPDGFIKTMNIDPSLLANSPWALFGSIIKQRLTGNDAYWFLSPGGYFGELTVSEVLKRTPNTAVLVFMHMIGVKVCHVGVSYERIGKRHAAFLRFRSPFITSHIVRDEDSKEYAKDVGLRVDGVLPDLALNLFKEPIKERETTNVYALCFRSDQYPDQARDVLGFIDNLVSVSPASVKFKIIVQVKRDLNFAKEISEFLNAISVHHEIVVSYESIIESQHSYSSCDIVIGNRLHGLLIGGSVCGCILGCVSYDYNKKVEGLLKSIGLNNIVRLEKLSSTFNPETLLGALNFKFDGVGARRRLVSGFNKIFSQRFYDEL